MGCGLEQEVSPAYAGIEVPASVVSVTGWLPKCDFSTLLGFPKCLWQHVETQPVPWGDLRVVGDTRAALGPRSWYQGAHAPPAPVVPCHGDFTEEIFHKAGLYL